MPNRPENIPAPMQYAYDVLNGEILVCRFVMLAVQRHFADLKNGHKRELYFDEAAAWRAINFFKFLKHSKGEFAGKPFELSPWQQFIVWVLFGWLREDGTRRFRYGYTEISRKNGKTTFAAGIGLYMMLGDKESGAEVYSAATTRDQAKICFEEAQRMVSKSGLKQYATVYKHNIHSTGTASKFEPLSSDADSLDGLNPHCAVIDEYHAHKDAEIYNVMKSAMGARTQPLQFIITTAGFNKFGPCYQLRKTLLEILEGKKEDDAFFAMVYTLDEDDDWTDETVWIKANPNLHYIPTMLNYLKQECKQAINNVSEEVNFKTKNLNVWTDASKTWLADAVWMQGKDEVDPFELAGRECYAGLDLASTRDITAFVLFFPAEDGESFMILPFFWIPEMSYQERVKKDGVNYDAWIKEGFIRTTPGNTTDYDQVKADIIALGAQYQIKSIAFDRWNSSQLVNQLVDEGATLSPFGQGFVSMNAPTKELEKMVYEGKLQHGGNPVLRWMCGNIEIKRDPAGNIKIDKGKSSEKVDGMVALVMAIGEWLTCKDETAPSDYILRTL